MRAVVQRVKSAQVDVAGRTVGKIGVGLVVFVGFTDDDLESDLRYIVDKVSNLRIFEDNDSKMNLSAIEKNVQILVVSQFTLYGDVRKGRRPSWEKAAAAEVARSFYDSVLKLFRETNLHIESGTFQADMSIPMVQDGPVTILVDSRKVF